MAHPCVSDVRSGTTSMPIGSRRMCGRGDSETCPPRYAVRSPPRSAAQACAASCTVVEKRKATNQRIPFRTISGFMVLVEILHDVAAEGARVRQEGQPPRRAGLVAHPRHQENVPEEDRHPPGTAAVQDVGDLDPPAARDPAQVLVVREAE